MSLFKSFSVCFKNTAHDANYYRIATLENLREVVAQEVVHEKSKKLATEIVRSKKQWKFYRSRFPKIAWPAWLNFDYLSISFPWARLKTFALETSRTGLYAVLVFALGFAGLNAGAYSEILKASVLSAMEPNRAEENTVAVGEKSADDKIIVARTPEAQRVQIPNLALAVTPPDNRLVIPKIDKNIPIIDADPKKLIGADWELLQKAFQEDLKNGVIRYPGTALPGETGNVFITGHSSYYPWDPGRYKSVFARLKEVDPGDEIILYYNQKEYRYRVREKREVKSNDVSVLQSTKDEKILTLMTCAPVGTNFRRLVVVAEQISE